MGCVFAILLYAIGVTIGFGLLVLIIKGICFAFSLTFSLKYVFGIWLILVLFNMFIRGVEIQKNEKS